jgi:hypothetical protein
MVPTRMIGTYENMLSPKVRNRNKLIFFCGDITVSFAIVFVQLLASGTQIPSQVSEATTFACFTDYEQDLLMKTSNLIIAPQA